MSRKVRPLPPESLLQRNPEGYARALQRINDRRERQGDLDRRRAEARRAIGPDRLTQDSAGLWSGLGRPVLHWRPLDLAARGYVWTSRGWRYPTKRRPAVTS